ncbi:hypothetical protein K470DRAFT_297284 [Piedraia hortae CBS 480.64]|uniref:CrcB-like protein n=1 Tax=Piedraia hortae CBS 480.64 TaxID=1314780 RepID=A0A6A7BRK6_9PEZI|nr:hypothetical protein K470DRAFT_297284 [Piedraia hortae CBS 480.64]
MKTLPPELISHLNSITHLIPSSILGVFIRLSLSKVPRNDFVASPTILWANITGCALMGFLKEDTNLLFHTHWQRAQDGPNESIRNENFTISKKFSTLYTALAVGLCGSLTTFSGLCKEVLLTLFPAAHASGGSKAASFLAAAWVHIGMPFIGFVFGIHVARFLNTTTLRARRPLGGLGELLLATISWASWLAILLLTIFLRTTFSRRWLFPLLFAPVGCMMRFYLSKYLNGKAPEKFVFAGTFASNAIGTIVLAITFDLQSSRVGRDVLTCEALQGLQDGFCGALTTVSSLVGELYGLKFGRTWWYGSITFGMGLGVVVAVIGGLGWSAGLMDFSCSVGGG